MRGGIVAGQAFARGSDPWTSHAAASSVERIRESQRAVLSVLKGNPMTDEEIFTALAQHGYVMSPSGARTRRKELVDLGLVEDTGVTILTKSGRGAIVWRMV